MKNKQFVEYSKPENKFRIDPLLYLDVDNQSRSELVDLFSIFTDNPIYRILVKKSTTLYLISAIGCFIVLIFCVLYLHLNAHPSNQVIASNDQLDTNDRLLQFSRINLNNRFLQIANSTNSTVNVSLQNNSPASNSSQSNDSNATDEAQALYNNIGAIVNKILNKTITEKTIESLNQLLDKKSNNQTTVNVTQPEQSTADSPNITSDNATTSNSSNQTTSSNNKNTSAASNSSQPRTVMVPSINSTLNKTGKNDSIYLNNTLNSNSSQNNTNANTNKASGFLLIVYIFLTMIAILFVLLVIFEIRKKQLFKNLKVFEETTLRTFHNKMNNRILISSCHEKEQICFLTVFQVYKFRFLVHNNGTENESINILNQNSTNPIQENQNESSIYKEIDVEGEKYHNAVINLNSQLKKEE